MIGSAPSRKRSRTGQVTVQTQAQVLRGQNPARRGLLLSNLGLNTVFLGTDPSVTASSGFGLTAGGYFTLDTGDDIYVVSAAGGEVVTWYEVTQ